MYQSQHLYNGIVTLKRKGDEEQKTQHRKVKSATGTTSSITMVLTLTSSSYLSSYGLFPNILSVVWFCCWFITIITLQLSSTIIIRVDSFVHTAATSASTRSTSANTCRTGIDCQSSFIVGHTENPIFRLKITNDNSINDKDFDDDDEDVNYDEGPEKFVSFDKDNEEPLTLIFQRGVVYQRSGDIDKALEEYEFFIKAAKNCNISPSMYSEVHVNIGAIHIKKQNINAARRQFELAIKCRPIRTAYVNLALLSMKEATSATTASTSDDDNDRSKRIKYIQEAKSYLYSAIDLDDNPSDPNEQSKNVATKLLEDVYIITDRIMKMTPKHFQ